MVSLRSGSAVAQRAARSFAHLSHIDESRQKLPFSHQLSPNCYNLIWGATHSFIPIWRVLPPNRIPCDDPTVSIPRFPRLKSARLGEFLASWITLLVGLFERKERRETADFSVVKVLLPSCLERTEHFGFRSWVGTIRRALLTNLINVSGAPGLEWVPGKPLMSLWLGELFSQLCGGLKKGQPLRVSTDENGIY